MTSPHNSLPVLNNLGILDPAIGRLLKRITDTGVTITGPSTAYALPGGRVRMEYPTESGEPFTFELEEGEWTRLDGTFEDIAGAEATAKEGRRAARLRALKEGGAA